MQYRFFIHLFSLLAFLFGSVSFCFSASTHQMGHSGKHHEGNTIPNYECCLSRTDSAHVLIQSSGKEENNPGEIDAILYNNIQTQFIENTGYKKMIMYPFTFHRDKQRFLFTDTIRLII